MTPIEPDYSIESVLASSKIADTLPIQELRRQRLFPEDGKTTSPKRISFRLSPRGPFVTLFGNGTATIRGCRSISQAHSLLEEVRRTVAAVTRVNDGRLRMAVQNIVALADLGRPLDLVKISETLASWDISYEPEQFPGLILHLGKGRSTVLVFSTGKIVLVGTRSEDQLGSTLKETISLLQASA